VARRVAAARFGISSPYLLKIRIIRLSNAGIRAGRFGVRIPVGSRYVLQNRVYRLSGPPSLLLQWAKGFFDPVTKRSECEVDHSRLAR
jgi:hypothetical protein